ncbi:ricin B lectin domain-containing protein [Coprinopsis sp. MPI-PUGE-AT-0042]|nr:ricin B lectin domain-containing protein [Coprinopsis sp. MPI-PUGE-AT-0042]KAH6884292.1 ricin B lectin domain-containing protein [Coprinopsis sp. MPI-PUGE-AT-0042]KAH6890181.1 ricin B lectin domain-containing protein [Coprinopsis sp. MPI-PUGE-AT-0042]KAH6906591.1 ricin B lectin domain-containing protein [Coprinopsis sp. MPI-PUGE-AT-0042]
MKRFIASSLVPLSLVAVGYAQSNIAATIHPVTDFNKCLDVRGAVFANGTPVQIYDCNGTNAQSWIWDNLFRTHIRLAGTNFCLDAGASADGTQMKIWECYDNLAQQDWAFDGNRIRLSGIRNTPLNNCLDLTDGRLENSNVIQVWQCSENNPNQGWSIAIPGTDPEPITTQPPPPQVTPCPQPTCAACPSGLTSTVVTPPGRCPTCACVAPGPVPSSTGSGEPPTATTTL